MNKQLCSERFMERTWGVTVVLACLLAMALAGHAAGTAQGAATLSVKGELMMPG